jgi:hypothetical protein
MTHPRRCIFDKAIRQSLGDLGREEARMSIGNAVKLRMQSRDHVGMAMAKARHGRAS